MANLDSIGPIENESVSSVTLTNSVQLGTRRMVNGVNYIYVYNSSNSQLSVGMPVGIGPNSMNSGYSVTLSNAASQVGAELIMGVVYHNTFATAAYGWIASRGIITGNPDASQISCNSGDFLTVGIDGGFVACTTFATQGTSIRLAVCLNSFVTNTLVTNKILFRSPFFE